MHTLHSRTQMLTKDLAKRSSEEKKKSNEKKKSEEKNQSSARGRGRAPKAVKEAEASCYFLHTFKLSQIQSILRMSVMVSVCTRIC